MKLAVITSHPIQYQAPLFRKIAKSGLDLTVYFQKETQRGYKDKEFGRELKWDIPLLEGYKHKFVSSTISLLRQLVRGNYAAVLVYGWNSWRNRLVVLLAPIFGIKVLLHGENPLNQELRKSKWKLFAKKILLKCFFGFVDAFLYIGEENKKFYRFYGVSSKKLFFVPYAIENERFAHAHKELSNSRHELRERLGVKPDDVMVFFVGKFIYKKRPKTLLRAYEKLVTAHSSQANCHLVYIGSGELEGDLKQYAKGHNLDNVHFVGFKNQTELPEYYTMADVFVLPSGAGETWGLVVNEAMNFGLPVITSDMVGSGADLVRDEENGFTFPLDDVGALAEKLEVLTKDKDLCKKFGEKSKEIVQEYSYEKDIKGIVSALKKCCN